MIGTLVLSCGQWWTEVSTVDGWAWLDLHLPRPTPGHPDDRPLPEYVEVFTQRGARVVHEFNFPAIRAVLPIAGIEELWPDLLSHAYAVPYADRYDIKVVIGFRSGTEDQWTALISDVGGQVDDIIGGDGIVSAIIPDTSAPTLRESELVEYVEHNGQFCVF